MTVFLINLYFSQKQTRGASVPEFELQEYPAIIAHDTVETRAHDEEFLIDEPILTKPIATYTARIRIHDVRQGKPSLLSEEDIEVDSLDE